MRKRLNILTVIPILTRIGKRLSIMNLVKDVPSFMLDRHIRLLAVHQMRTSVPAMLLCVMAINMKMTIVISISTGGGVEPVIIILRCLP